MKLQYQAIDQTGQAVRDTIDAADTLEATNLLRQRGLFVTKIHAQQSSAGKKNVKGGRVGANKRLKFLSSLTRQLHILTSTGTPVVQALEAAEEQTEELRCRVALGQVRRDVEEGQTLAEAMSHRSGYFSPVFTSVIAAGEASGNMSAILKRLSSLTREQLQLRRTVTGAMIYPTLMVVLGTVVLLGLLLFVLPRFADMFNALDAPLPPTTQMLMALSDSLHQYWYLYLIGFGAMGYGLFWLAMTPKGRGWIGLHIISMPRFGPLIQQVLTARIVRLLGVLLDSKVEMLEALSLVRKAAGNPRYADLLARAEESVGMGEPLSRVFAESPLINNSVSQAIRNGENSGQLGPLLLNMADYLEEDNQVAIQSLSSLLEPLILMFLGLIVGLVAISMFLPLFDLTAAGGGA